MVLNHAKFLFTYFIEQSNTKNKQSNTKNRKIHEKKKNNTYQIMISNYHAKTATKKINNFILELI